MKDAPLPDNRLREGVPTKMSERADVFLMLYASCFSRKVKEAE